MKRRNDIIDLLVVGGGTAGIVGATTAARLGARTVLVESARTGGDCLWTGCIPSKTLLSAARSGAAGVPVFAEIRKRISRTIDAIEPDDSPAALEAAGVSVLSGTARFTRPGEAEVDGRLLRFRQALIATGASPVMPPIPGLPQARVVTSETVWDVEELPRRLVVIGGGPLGCELGQAFARLGSRVVLLARSEILPREDPEAAAVVRGSLISDGVEVREGALIERVTGNGTGGASTVHTAGGQGFEADLILVAAGRKARTGGLGLEHLGVECDEAGHVLVDRRMRSSHPLVWAAGDVTPHPRYTHLAGVHASTAASNAVLGLRRRVSTVAPRVTFTSPELAAVGLTSARGRGLRASTIQHVHADRALTEQQTAGFTRIVTDRRGRILGGTIVGPRAGESLAELTLAVHRKLTTRDLAGVTHPYPTYNDALWNAAIADAGTALDSRVVRSAVRALAGLARRRADRTAR
jgi:pyruvate/2-oxoglutarate dehydrogenase complex dihydrolipoamide dehydrogenase (E3) component